MSLLFDAIPANPLIDRFVDLSFEVSERIIRLLRQKGMTQRDLANLLQKKDSEVSRWLQGDHNFTLKSIAAVEIALGEQILRVQGIRPQYFMENAFGVTSLITIDSRKDSEFKSTTKSPKSQRFVTMEHGAHEYQIKQYTTSVDLSLSGNVN